MDEELYHHGIKGMRWGVRRSPEQLGHNRKSKASKSQQIKQARKDLPVLQKQLSKAYDNYYNANSTKASKKYYEIYRSVERKYMSKLDLSIQKTGAEKAAVILGSIGGTALAGLGLYALHELS